ncbi:MAG: very short patch repair endonuclease [Phyllobacteriaceae bacterium]|nr:very short patch repair endonuclease [Phyllobacteriaceae bacterium]
MPDKLSPAERSENMRRIKSRDTKPEMLVRRLIHGMGYRYRLHKKGLPGKPDLVFSSRKKVIFVHGCFWHGHDAADCRDGKMPKSNTGYWLPKLARNKERDTANVAELEACGWQVMIVWDCETRDTETLGKRIRTFLS